MEVSNMEFRKYDKIHRLGKEEVEGILCGTCQVSEKIDGANLSVWIGTDDTIHVGSRNNDLTLNGNEFNGAVEYCILHEGINKYLRTNPTHRLYGEWLVKHTINYRPTSYKKFYLFDIRIEDGYLLQNQVIALAEEHGIEHVPHLGIYENPTMEQLNALLGGSEFGDRGEGIVIKNLEFRNKFGELAYAKIVREDFKEDNGVMFGGNNKFSDSYWEMYVINKYVTVARVQKMMNKIQPMIDKKLDMEHIPRICESVYHDLVTEEAWEISKKVKKLDYDVLKRIAYKKIRQVYVDVLNESISVADMK